MQHLCSRLKVDVAADVYTITLRGECIVLFVSHQVVLDILRRQLHIIRSSTGPSLTSVCIAGHIKLRLTVFRHHHIGKEHRNKALARGILVIGQIAVGTVFLQFILVCTHPVGIIVPVAGSGSSSPYQIFRHHLHRYDKRTETCIATFRSTLLFKMNCKSVSISLLGLEAETIFLLGCCIKINLHLIFIRRSFSIRLCM
ncbi:unknown [Prevotella sp. CAG:617]|nr:unknown [Prevotella sp. CAG:617]